MEMQVIQSEPLPSMANRQIKIERDEDERDPCESSEAGIPCVSTVPIPADKNTGSYYYPSQAVVSPRTPIYTTVSKMAQKRKTVQALAQVSFKEIELCEDFFCNVICKRKRAAKRANFFHNYISDSLDDC